MDKLIERFADGMAKLADKVEYGFEWMIVKVLGRFLKPPEEE